MKVLNIQIKPHRWVINGPYPQFNDLYNLAYTRYCSWMRGHESEGTDSHGPAGVDGVKPRSMLNRLLVPTRSLMGYEPNSRPERYGL